MLRKSAISEGDECQKIHFEEHLRKQTSTFSPFSHFLILEQANLGRHDEPIWANGKSAFAFHLVPDLFNFDFTLHRVVEKLVTSFCEIYRSHLRLIRLPEGAHIKIYKNVKKKIL